MQGWYLYVLIVVWCGLFRSCSWLTLVVLGVGEGMVQPGGTHLYVLWTCLSVVSGCQHLVPCVSAAVCWCVQHLLHRCILALALLLLH